MPGMGCPPAELVTTTDVIVPPDTEKESGFSGDWGLAATMCAPGEDADALADAEGEPSAEVEGWPAADAFGMHPERARDSSAAAAVKPSRAGERGVRGEKDTWVSRSAQGVLR